MDNHKGNYILKLKIGVIVFRVGIIGENLEYVKPSVSKKLSDFLVKLGNFLPGLFHCSVKSPWGTWQTGS